VSTALASDHARLALHGAVERARMAPSLLDTQPWHIALTGSAVAMSLVRAGQLPVIDPNGRQAIISCGAALLNARVSLARANLVAMVERFPPGADSPLFARLRTRWPDSAEELTPDHDLGPLESSIGQLQAFDRRNADAELPRSLVAKLAAMTAAEDALLVGVIQRAERLRVEELHRRVERLVHADAAYQAELRLWSHPCDRDRDFSPPRLLPAQCRGRPPGTLLLFGTDTDDPMAWLRVGEALQRVRLELTRRGYVSTSLIEILTVPAARSGLRRGLGLHFHPQALLRVEHALSGVPTPREAETLRSDVAEESIRLVTRGGSQDPRV
jgi:hypothetical protein